MASPDQQPSPDSAEVQTPLAQKIDQLRAENPQLSPEEAAEFARQKFDESRRAEPGRDRRTSLLVLVLGGFLAFGVLGGLWIVASSDGNPGLTPGVVPPDPVPLTTAPTAVPIVPTPDPALAIRQDYEAGLAAYTAGDWENAAASFRRVYRADRSFQDIAEKLAATHYNWGIALLNSAREGDAMAEAAHEALRHLYRSVAAAPDQADAFARQEMLRSYLDGVKAVDDQNWAAAVERFEQVEREREREQRVREPPHVADAFFDDSARRLLGAYLAQARPIPIESGTDADELGRAAALLAQAAALEERLGNAGDEAASSLEEVERLLRDAAPRLSRQFDVAITSNTTSDGSAGNRDSCVSGRVVDDRGSGIEAATIEVNNGSTFARTVSGEDGSYLICGMGADTWSVVLLFVPGSPPIDAQSPPLGKISVNGEQSSRAEVSFEQR